jgi:hypothetical protein
MFGADTPNGRVWHHYMTMGTVSTLIAPRLTVPVVDGSRLAAPEPITTIRILRPA